MKFSVLLPTRNRLEYLRYAVETVRRQDYQDWEIIISDNFSEDDIAGYAKSLDDPRIKYYRTSSFVPVTDNWNNALGKSSGDYVIMLGDDDCLMKGYFTTVRRLIKEYAEPEFIYTSAFLYAYPGVMPGSPEGFLQPYGYSIFFRSAEAPFWLDKKKALELVQHSMNFKVMFGYNMQFSLVSRRFIDSLKGKGSFYQSPFPDYYASNVMFLKAERMLICPYPLVTIGISPKSYGFFHFNNLEAGGIEFLKSLPDPESARRLRHVLLPGTNINTSWLLAMEAIKANYGSEADLRINYSRYRFLQIVYVYEHTYAQKVLPKEVLHQLKKQMRLWERLVYGSSMSTVLALKKLLSPAQRGNLSGIVKRATNRVSKQFPAGENWEVEVDKRHYKNILEVFEQVNPLGN